jgi:RNA polymerase sigma-70 factor (ECF subfamily)
VWFIVYRYRHTFAGRGSFEAWLRCVATNVCLSDRRLRQGERKGLAGFRILRTGRGAPVQEGSPLERLEREEQHVRFHQALGSLSLREAEAITLRKLEGRSADEVASIMGVGKATVRSLIRRGVERLRRNLERKDDALP